MKKLRPSTQYKKDLKRIRNNPAKAAELLKVLSLLENGLPLPEHYRPHALTGDYTGCMECHVQGVFLLVRINEEEDTVYLVRLGSHSELFGKASRR